MSTTPQRLRLIEILWKLKQELEREGHVLGTKTIERREHTYLEV